MAVELKKRDEFSHRTSEGQKATRLLSDISIARNEIPAGHVVDSSIVKDKEQAYARPWQEALLKLEATELRRQANPAWLCKGTSDTMDSVAQQLLGRTPTLEIPPTSLADPPVHVNAAISALLSESALVSPQVNAWPVFGGVCSNVFPPRTAQWEVHALPKLSLARANTVTSITNMLLAHVDALIAHCETPKPPVSPESTCTIPLSTAIPDQDAHLLKEVKSEIHIVHLPHQKTYHLTKYRKHVVDVSAPELYRTIVAARKARRDVNEANLVHYEAFPSGESRDGILLMHGPSRYGATTGYFDSQWMLSREFEAHWQDPNAPIMERYCSMACSITRDARESARKEKFTHEWANWSVYQKRVTSAGVEVVELIEMAVSMGIRNADTNEFIPYDENPLNESHSPSVRFNDLVDKLVVHCNMTLTSESAWLIASLRSARMMASINSEPPPQPTKPVRVERRAAPVTNPPAPPVPASNLTIVAPPTQDNPRKRSRRDDAFEAAKLLCANYANDFKPEELACVANVFARHANDAAVFLALGNTPVQRAWVAEKIRKLQEYTGPHASVDSSNSNNPETPTPVQT